MRTFILVAALTVGGLLLDARPAQAQYPFAPRMYPTHYYGFPVAPYLNNFGFGYNYVGGPYTETRNTVYNPFTGYYLTQVRGFSYPFGYYGGWARGWGTPGPGTFTMQYIPSYYSPSFFRPNYSGVSSTLPTY
jgi:hypothetical protein